MVNQNSIFGGMLTTAGAAKKTNCDALGVPWQPSNMLIGDANGADPVPNPGQTELINQVYRAPLNQLYVSPTDPNVLVAELVLPPNVGGWWIRELALEDVDGVFSAVANCAPSYKPLLVQNSGRNQVVRMHIVTSGTANIQLKIDPSVVLATREFVTEELAKQDFKHSVLVATTGPIVLSGLQTIDAVVLPAGAAVLVKDQVAAKENGIYVVSAGTWTRRADADTSAKVTPGLLVHVEKGAINGDGVWQLVTDGPINLRVSALAFEMAFGRTGVVAGTYRSVTVDKYGRVVGATKPTTVAGYGLTDVYTNTQIDQALAAKAPLASPEFTGTPKAPTAPAGTNTTQMATTAFVQQEIAGDLATAAPQMDGVAAVGVSTKLAREDHRHPTDTTRAPLASPALTGIPTAPTAPAGTNSTQLANTAFVQTALAALVASSPAALDTLNELAAALGNDPNFATTITNLLAGKQPLDSDLTALAALTTVGFYVNTGVGSVAARSITAGTGVSVANGNGVAGDPVVSLSDSGVAPGTYKVVRVGADGRVTGGTNPTTVAGLGIIDAVKAGDKALEADAEGGVDNTKWVTVAGVSVALSAAFAGCVVHFARNTAPAGFLKANGALVSRTAYSRLFSAIGTTFGAGDGATTFQLPDLRGLFVRGWDDGRGIDTGRAFGGYQADELKSHDHDFIVNSTDTMGNKSADSNGAGTNSTATTAATGGTETRPRNLALLACIKY